MSTGAYASSRPSQYSRSYIRTFRTSVSALMNLFHRGIVAAAILSSSALVAGSLDVAGPEFRDIGATDMAAFKSEVALLFQAIETLAFSERGLDNIISFHRSVDNGGISERAIISMDSASPEQAEIYRSTIGGRQYLMRRTDLKFETAHGSIIYRITVATCYMNGETFDIYKRCTRDMMSHPMRWEDGAISRLASIPLESTTTGQKYTPYDLLNLVSVQLASRAPLIEASITKVVRHDDPGSGTTTYSHSPTMTIRARRLTSA